MYSAAEQFDTVARKRRAPVAIFRTLKLSGMKLILKEHYTFIMFTSYQNLKIFDAK